MATKKPITTNVLPARERAVIDAHAAIQHLIDEWDLAWAPHQAYAQLHAIEGCLHSAERSPVASSERISEEPATVQLRIFQRSSGTRKPATYSRCCGPVAAKETQA